MPAIVSPSLVALSSTASTNPAARGRTSDEPEGRSFHATLDRTRAAQADAGKAEGATDGTTTARPGTRRGAAASKDDAPLDIPNLAFFAPAVPAQLAVATSRAGAEASTASALRDAASATARTDAQDALAGAAADGSAAATDADPTALAADAAQIAALADGTAADGAPNDPLAAARKAIAAAAAPAAANAETTAAKTPAADASVLGAALASTMPTTPAPVPTARTGRTDSATRDTAGSAASTTASGTATAKADPLDTLARVEVTAAGDADNQGTDADPSPTAWLTAQPTGGVNGGTERAAATDSRVPVLSLAPPVDSDAWAPALSQQMLRMSASGMHTAQLNLNPEHLGPLQITLKLGEDQAQAVFSSAHEGVRKAVEAALPQLRTSLAEHGISLGQTSVGADTRQPAGQSTFAGDQPSNRSNGSGAGYPGAGRDTSVSAVEARPNAPVRSARVEGAVDTFA